MLVRNVSFSLMLLIGTMTGSESFAIPRGSPAFTIQTRVPPLHDTEVPEPESSPESIIKIEAEDCVSSFMGIDEVFIPFPHRDYTAPDVVQMCMDALAYEIDDPYANAGLEVCFNFSSDRCRAAQGGSLQRFIQYAHNPVFGSMVNAKDWTVISTGPIIQGTPTRGAMQTQLIEVKPEKGGDGRRFLWTLQQERRPPRQGCWLVYECISMENAYSLTL